MDTEINAVVQRIHDSPRMAVVAVAGAGNQAVQWLLRVAGASRTLLEVRVPYSASAFTEFIGCMPGQFVSEETARRMANAAYQRALRLREKDVPVGGVVCSATIATDRPKRGEHRCHAAAWDERGITTYSLQFVKGLRDRTGEDAIASLLVLRALAESCGVPFDLVLPLDDREQVVVESVRYADPIEALLAEHIQAAIVRPDGSMSADAPVSGAVLAGSFNPLHEGHLKLAEVASEMMSAGVTFELSVLNVDKPPLEEAEVRKRVAQFYGKRSVAVTRALRFQQKARLFPGCTFVIGWDTAVRLVDPRYYEGSQVRMLLALEEMRSLGCRFLVAGREKDGVFHTLDDVPVPDEFREMFLGIPESAFRMDLSSTRLRLAGRGL